MGAMHLNHITKGVNKQRTAASASFIPAREFIAPRSKRIADHSSHTQVTDIFGLKLFDLYG